MNKFNIGIDASRNRSGGARAHIIGILNNINPLEYGINKVHLWAYKSLLEQIPNFDWLVKHNPDNLEKGLLSQVLWQKFIFPKELKLNNCDVLLSTDAGTFCRFKPAVVMSRDMLSFEFKEMERYKGTLFWVRLKILQYIQISSLKYSSGALFLTNYAKNIITKNQNFTNEIRVIPHGISDSFRNDPIVPKWTKKDDVVNCIYVSNADLYKHQWVVLEAFKKLFDEGYKTKITFVGARSGRDSAIEKINKAINKYDPDSLFSLFIEFKSHNEISDFLKKSDIFIFASSCENMPNTLIEGMSIGLPICSSNLGPMPEILKDSGTYFNPEDSESIVSAIKKMLDDSEFAKECAIKSNTLSKQYSWARCADETFKYLFDINLKWRKLNK